MPNSKHAPSRRQFLGSTAAAFAALTASGCMTRGAGAGNAAASPYGALVPDPEGVLDLPPGFSYRVLSRLGEPMADGEPVPDAADGMGCFDLGAGRLALVRNHELTPKPENLGRRAPAFDTSAGTTRSLPGGTTTLVLDASTLEVEREFRSLAGTIRNCAGGITPWNSWLTCEETTATVAEASGQITQDHGWVFEVPASATGLVDPVPLKAMGRFNHEAAAVDPETGIVYLTEDREDSLLYRFIPEVRGKLARGGRLQALVSPAASDSRNWSDAAVRVGADMPVRWLDLDDVESPQDDLRQRGHAAGAMLFARGEGIHMGEGELYFCCTSGGAAKQGQVFRLKLGMPGSERLSLFFESTSPDQFSYGDNICVAPSGHLVVCEDQYGLIVDNYLRGITPAGAPYPLARVRLQTEPAGACFSPDGRTMFLNLYSPTMTLAITGPWLS